jgi:hypothetical protein
MPALASVEDNHNNIKGPGFTLCLFTTAGWLLSKMVKSAAMK